MSIETTARSRTSTMGNGEVVTIWYANGVEVASSWDYKDGEAPEVQVKPHWHMDGDTVAIIPGHEDDAADIAARVRKHSPEHVNSVIDHMAEVEEVEAAAMALVEAIDRRDAAVVAARQVSVPVSQIAQAAGVTRPTVYRILGGEGDLT